MALPGHRDPSVFDRLDGLVIHTPPQVSKRSPADSGQHDRGAWVQPRNGLPPLKPYARAPQDPAEAERDRWAWQTVADIQARLHGEPPQPVDEPWNLPPCAGCGHRMRCACGHRALTDADAPGPRATATPAKAGQPFGVTDCALPAFEPFTPGADWYRELAEEDGAL